MATLKAWLWWALLCPTTGWTYSCTLDLDGITMQYTGTPAETVQDVWVHCTREPAEWPKTSVPMRADLGSNPTDTQPFRSVRRGGSTHRLAYTLHQRGYSGGCDAPLNWLAPGEHDPDAVSRSIFWKTGGGVTGTVRFALCLTVIGPVGPSGSMPAAGAYQDQFQVTVGFVPLDALPAHAPIIRTVPVVVHVASHCRLEPPQHRLKLNYTSFSREDILATTETFMACSEGEHWSARIDPPEGTLLGLTYSLSLRTPHSAGRGTLMLNGTGTGEAQRIDIVGHMAAGQAGTCGRSECNDRQTHTLTIEY